MTTLDDRHVMGKHAAIYPREEELKSVHEMVTLVERALKALSDQFVDEDHPIAKGIRAASFFVEGLLFRSSQVSGQWAVLEE